MHNAKTIVAQMYSRKPSPWVSDAKEKNYKRLLRTIPVFAAVCLCLGIGVWAHENLRDSSAVISHFTAGFEYDDTLGRLQFVSNLLPESAMVFLSSTHAEQEMLLPAQAEISHDWTQSEPWLEFNCAGDVFSCQNGEIMTIVKNRANEYTVRILHNNGYESVYSGLNSVHLHEHDSVFAGQAIGTSAGQAAFELRKDGLSVLPVFSNL